MQTKLETITPSVAESYLKLNTNNRQIREKHVYFLRDEIVDGRWQLNGATIVLGENRLLDGQHRLMAIVAARKAITSLVVHGVPEKYFSTIDTGTSRKPMDVLKIKGEKSTFLLAPAIQWVIRYRNGTILNKKRVSYGTIEQFLDENPTIRKSLYTARDVRIMSVPVATAAHFLFSKKDETLADLFLDGIKNGFTKKDDDPFFVFRERMIENRHSTAKLTGLHQFALMVKAWNLMRGGEGSGPVHTFKPAKKIAEFETIR